MKYRCTIRLKKDIVDIESDIKKGVISQKIVEYYQDYDLSEKEKRFMSDEFLKEFFYVDIEKIS